MKTQAKIKRIFWLAGASTSFLLASCTTGQSTIGQPQAEQQLAPGASFADALTPTSGVACRIPNPRYPEPLRRLNARGSVRLTFVANTIGRVDLVIVDRSSGTQEFDSAARDAVSKATCTPYVVDGLAHRVVQHVTINFSPKLPAPAAPTASTASTASTAPIATPSQAPITPPVASTPVLTTPPSVTLDQAIRAATLQRLGIAPDSPKAAILERWGKRMHTDPDVSRFLGAGPNQANVFLLSPTMRSGFFVEGVLRLSAEDRSKFTELMMKSLDNAPPDCGGIKDIAQLQARYMSLATMSDAELDESLRVTFEIFRQSARQSPIAQVSEEQRVRGLQEVANTLRSELKDDPGAIRDVAATIADPTHVSAQAWCTKQRIYRRALFATPQPYRDWALVAGDTDARARLASLPQTRALHDSAAPTQ